MNIPTNEEDQVRFIVNLFHRVREEMADWREQAVSYIRAYNSQVEDDYPLKFKLFYPLSFSTIETILPRFVHGLLYRKPMIQVAPSHPMTDPLAVRAASRLLNDKWLVDPETWYDIRMMVKEAILIGTSMGKIGFSQKKRRVRQMTPVMVNGRRTGAYEKWRTVNVENRPRIYHRDMFDVYPDIARVHQSQQRFTFDFIIKGMDEIRHGDIAYENLDELEEVGDCNIDDAYVYSRVSEDPNSDTYTFDQTVVPDNPRSLLEFTFREWTDEGEAIRVITIGNEQVKMRDEYLPYWPWVDMRHNPMPGQYLGRSELQPIKSIQLNLNDIYNMNMEQAMMALLSMWVVSDEAEADLDQFDILPNGIIQVSGDVSQVRREIWGDVNPGGLKLQEVLMQAGRDATGVSDFLRGANPSRKEFATTVMALQQAAEARLDSRIKEFEKSSISEIARGFIECAQEYLEDPEYIKNEDDSFSQIDMYMIQGLMDFNTNAAAMGIKELERTSLTDFASSVGQVLGETAPMDLRFVLVKAMASTFENMPEEVHVTLERYIEQAKAQQAAAATTQGAGPQGLDGNQGIDGASGVAGPPEAVNPAQAGAGQAAPEGGGLESAFALF